MLSRFVAVPTGCGIFESASPWENKQDRPHSDELDGSVVAGSGGEPAIACEQWGAKLFGKHDIRRVVR